MLYLFGTVFRVCTSTDLRASWNVQTASAFATLVVRSKLHPCCLAQGFPCCCQLCCSCSWAAMPLTEQQRANVRKQVRRPVHHLLHNCVEAELCAGAVGLGRRPCASID